MLCLDLFDALVNCNVYKSDSNRWPVLMNQTFQLAKRNQLSHGPMFLRQNLIPFYQLVICNFLQVPSLVVVALMSMELNLLCFWDIVFFSIHICFSYIWKFDNFCVLFLVTLHAETSLKNDISDFNKVSKHEETTYDGECKYKEFIFGEEALRISPCEPYCLRRPIRRGHFNVSSYYPAQQVDNLTILPKGSCLVQQNLKWIRNA